MRARTSYGYRISKWLILALFTAGLGVLAFYFCQRHAIRETEHWQTTEGIVVMSRDISLTRLHESEEIGTHPVKQNKLAFAFSYTVAGHDYVSKRFYLVGECPAEFVAKNYPPGHRFIARYNPSVPAEAIVEAGLANHQFLILALLLLGFSAVFGANNYYG